MTNQEFDEFWATVEGNAKSYENLPDGSALVTCADGLQMIVDPDGNTRVIRQTVTLERAREIGAPQGVAQCPECGAYLPLHEGYLDSPCPEPGCLGVLSVAVGVE